MPYLFGAFILAVVTGIVYQTIIVPRKWMKDYGDGVYNPLRRTYIKAGADNARK